MNYIDLFKEIVDTCGDRIAVVDKNGERKTSYKNLDILSGRVANKLHTIGIKKGDKVLVYIGRKVEYIAATLGILKVGAVIVPTILEYPQERIDSIMSIAEAKYIIKEDFYYDINKYELYSDIADDFSPAIMFFTSGSTGKPKGIIHTVRDLVNATKRHKVMFEGVEDLTTVSILPFSFVAYLADTLYCFYNKTTLHIINEEDRKDVTKVEDYLDKNNITFCNMSPQFLRLFKSKNKCLKRVMVGSERVINAYSKDYETYVLYGATEFAGIATYFKVDKNYDNTPIGYPLEGLKAYVLDEEGKEVKKGEIGELCMEYECFSQYYQDEERTKRIYEKLDNGKVLYHTNDLVYINEDDAIVFVNRKDFMVKINGQRVEPYEIESNIAKVNGIRNAVVKAFEDNNKQTYLVAYYEANEELKQQIVEELNKKLPYYMIPRYFVRLDSLPKNVNGKLDRTVLQAPDIALFKNEYVAPKTELEKNICLAFEKVLGVEQVGIKDDFFVLGGDSIKILKLINEIKAINISTDIIFEGKTPENIAKLAKELSERNIKHQDNYDKGNVLNYSMQGIYLDSYDDKNTVKYNISLLATLPNDIDSIRFKNAVKTVIDSHRVFASYISDEDGIVKINQGDGGFDLKIIDKRNEKIDLKKECDEFIKPFDIKKAPLYRCALFETSENKYIIFDVHHLIFDGSSVSVFLNEIINAYNDVKNDEETLNVFDIANNEQLIKDSNVYKASLDFYKNKFDEVDCISKPVSDRVVEIDLENENEARTIKHNIEKDVSAKDVLTFVKKNGITENTLFTAVFAYTLAKFNYANDVVFTTASSGRHDKRLANAIGMFVKTLPLYFKIDDNMQVKDFLTSANEYIFETVKNDIVSFQELAKLYDLNNEVSFVYQSELLSGIKDISVDTIDVKEAISDISFMVLKNETYDIRLTYKVKTYTNELMESLLYMYVNVLKNIIKVDKLSEISFVNTDAIDKINKLNKTEKAYDENKTIVDIFRENAKTFADRIALVSKNKKYTYKELDILTDKIATMIYGKGGSKEKVVGILVDRNENMLICALSALKANCAYLPLDPTYPAERLNFMVSDAETFMLISEEKYDKVIDDTYKGIRISVSEFEKLTEIENDLPKPKSSDLFSLVYTSGTTGKPKGVMYEHSNVMCLVNWAIDYYEMDENSKATSYASFGFDANIKDMYPIIASGGELHIITDDIRLDLNEVKKYFNENGITQSVMTTQVARQFAQLEGITTLKHIMAGGEKLVPFEPSQNFKFHNGYGPCECTVLVSAQEVDKKYKDIPVGKALENVKLYIVDNLGRLLPAGATGELLVSGPRVTRGYLNRPEKTNEVYCENIYCKEKGYERVYKTGDVLRFLDDGTLQYVGRRDAQVKIRGFRVELTEIEEVIRRYNDIKDATVVAYDDVKGGKYLVAYVVSDITLDTSDIAGFIGNEKPPYMVPQIIMQIDAIPYTQNQKVNKRALPMPERKIEDVIAPSTDVQKKIFEILSKIVGNDDFGVNTDIYYAGLTSIGAVEFNVKLSETFNKQIKIADLKENNTIEKLEKFLQDNKGNDDSFVELKLNEGEYPITETQSGVFVECTQEKDTINYNIPVLFKLSMNVEVAKLVSAINKTFANHPYLFTKLIMKDNGDICATKQDIEEVVTMQYVDELPDSKSLIRPFKLLDSRLFRVEIYFTNERENYYLFADLHHIIADGSSINILIEDVRRAYRDEVLEQEKISGFELGIEEIKNRNSTYYIKAKEYYNKLISEIEINTLPIKCPDKTSGVGVIRKQSKANINEIKDFCKKNKLSLNAFCNAVFGYLLSRYSYKDEVVFCSIYNGRSDIRHDRTVSMLVKTLPIVYKTKKEEKVIEYIENMQRQLLDNMSYDVYSFAEIKKDLGVSADIIFAFQNDEFNFDFDKNNIENMPLDFNVAKAPLSVNLSIKDGHFDFDMSFDKTYFSNDYVASLIDTFEIVACNFIKEEKVRKVSLLSNDVKLKIDKINETTTKYDKVPVYEIFERQVKEHSDRICYVFDGKSFTYDDINKSANKIANYLIDKGIKQNSIVGMLLNRSQYIPMAQYGIMKAGAAFTSLIPEYPDDRIDFCLRNADSPAIITTEKVKNEKKNLFESIKNCQVYTMEEILQYEKDNNPNLNISVDNLAYCIYTSGTTGTPKGVLIKHKNITCLVQTSPYAKATRKENGSATNALAMANITFDGSMCEHIVQTCNGNTVFITKENDIHNPLAIINLILDNKIEFMFATPSLMATLIDIEEFAPALRQIKIYLTAAEAFTKLLFDKIKSINKNILIIDGYGPSECTVGCNERVVYDEDDLNIGKPAENTKLYVFDKDRNQLPFYALGEIVIGGDLVGAGYVKLKEKTEQVFIDFNGERVYCCGDVVRQKEDGNFDFFGRIDNLVKLRGYRVELEEIEKVICEFKNVTRSKVIVRNNGKEDFLAAFFTATEEIDTKELIKFMKSKLTYYMVPSAIMQLEKFELNASGKIDKTKLPEIVTKKKEQIKAKKALTNDLCEIFKTILNLDEFSPNDDFFEMGGTSLSASKITMKLLSKNIQVEYGDVFDHPTPEDLASFIEQKYGIVSDENDETDDTTSDFEIKYERVASKVVKDVLKYNTMQYTKELQINDLGDVLLTGANGFLGIHILRELLEVEKGHIYAIIRKGDFESSEARLKSVLFYYFGKAFNEDFTKRITVLDMDITDENLGDKLKDIKIDTIINAAACVKHYANTDILEKINVGGVKNLIKVAFEKNAKLTQISTTSIVGLHTEESYSVRLRIFEDEHFVVKSDDNKYVLSKFDAETAIFEAVSKGLKGKVVRVGNLMGRQSDGEFQINFDTNGFLNALRGFAAIGKSPVTHLTDPMRFSPIDCTARAVVLLSKTNDMFTAFNAENRFSFDEMQLIDACNRNGIKIVPTEDDVYYKDFKERLGDDKLNKRLSALIAYDRPGVHPVTADNEFTGNILYRIGFSWPLMDASYLDRLIDGLKTLNFFEV